MKCLLIFLLLCNSAHAGLSLTDQLVMESRIQNQLQQQQRLDNFGQSLRLQEMQDEIDSLKRQQEGISPNDAALLLWILQNRPDLLRTK